MSNERSDHPAIFRREESIATIALRWREYARTAQYAYFNITTFVKECLCKALKGGVQIRFDIEAERGPAYVMYNPTRLFVDQEIWELAGAGEPDARFIIAHEIGHIILHEDDVRKFSNDPAARLKIFVEERSSEWQANIFAFYFLLPDLIVAAYRTIEELSVACNVTQSIARQRVGMSRRLLLLYSASETGVCPSCGDFIVGGKCKSTACQGQLATSREDVI